MVFMLDGCSFYYAHLWVADLETTFDNKFCAAEIGHVGYTTINALVQFTLSPRSLAPVCVCSISPMVAQNIVRTLM